mmetsp:Transcript_3651/g.7762  ORF Transcript_3651/g.7762 Transcript_3651/m.7762 type:complete len:222 (+) Transcript_3651:554-1219(+)
MASRCLCTGARRGRWPRSSRWPLPTAPHVASTWPTYLRPEMRRSSPSSSRLLATSRLSASCPRSGPPSSTSPRSSARSEPKTPSITSSPPHVRASPPSSTPSRSSSISPPLSKTVCARAAAGPAGRQASFPKAAVAMIAAVSSPSEVWLPTAVAARPMAAAEDSTARALRAAVRPPTPPAMATAAEAEASRSPPSRARSTSARCLRTWASRSSPTSSSRWV